MTMWESSINIIRHHRETAAARIVVDIGDPCGQAEQPGLIIVKSDIS